MGGHGRSSKNGAKVTKPRRRRSARVAARKANAVQRAATELESLGQDSISVENSVNMKLAAALPRRIIINKDIPVPVVVLFEQGNEKISDADDIWAFASLVEETVGTSSREDLLLGQRVDSVHNISAPTVGLRNTFGYASFPNLQVSQLGRFRLRITPVDMKGSDRVGRVLPTLTSEVFDVVDSSVADIGDIPTNGTLAQLKQLGIID